MRTVRLLAASGVTFLVAAVVLVVAVGDQEVARVVAIGLAVLGLAALRACSWVRRTRALTRVGLDLHVPEDYDD